MKLMSFVKSGEILGTNVLVPSLSEGDYSGEVKQVNYLKDCSTDYGYRDFLEIEYNLTIGITEQVKKEKIMVSSAENSRCYEFLKEVYKGIIPENINLDDLIGRECILTIKHNQSSDGRIYANIVERKFK